MAIGFVNYVTGTTSSSSATAVLDLSSGFSVNDVAIVVISRSATVAPSGTPSGWSLLQSDLSTYGVWVYAKKLASGDLISNLTWTWAAATKTLIQASVYSGCDTTTPWGTSVKGTYGTASGTTCDCGTSSYSNPWVVAVCSCYSTTSKTYSALTGWTERRDYGTTSPDFWQLLADTNGTWGGGTCAPDFTISSSTYRGGYLVPLNKAVETLEMASTLEAVSSVTITAGLLLPLTTSGLVFQLAGSKAAGGTGPGVNSPLTDPCTETVGSATGDLVNFAGTTSSGYAGAGTTGDPYVIVFDGTDDEITFGDLAAAEVTEGSFEAWFYKDDTLGHDSGRLAQKRTSAVDGWSFYPDRLADQYNFSAQYSDATDIVTLFNLGSAIHGSWMHVIFTYETSTGYLKCYHNGTQLGTTQTPAGAGDSIKVSSASLYVGQRDTGTRPFGGKIATIRIYNRPLSADEVAGNYNAGVTAVVGSTREMAFTTEAVSAVTITGEKTDVTLEMASTLEAISSVTIVGEKTAAATTHEMAFTTEAISGVTVVGEKTVIAREMAFTLEAVSVTTITASKTDVTLEMASTLEAVSAVTITASVAHATLEMASTTESISTVTIVGEKTDAILEMAFTREATSTVSITATRNFIWDVFGDVDSSTATGSEPDAPFDYVMTAVQNTISQMATMTGDHAAVNPATGSYYGYNFSTYLTHLTGLLTKPVWDVPGDNDGLWWSTPLSDYNSAFSYLPTDDDASRRYYSRDEGGVHFVHLSTDGPTAMEGLGATQLAWLEDDLAAAANQTAPIIVFMHEPTVYGKNNDWYAVGSGGPDEADAIHEMFAHYGVDFVFSGSTHTFRRTQHVCTFNGVNRTVQFVQIPSAVSSTHLVFGVGSVYALTSTEWGWEASTSYHGFAQMEWVPGTSELKLRLYSVNTSNGAVALVTAGISPGYTSDPGGTFSLNDPIALEMTFTTESVSTVTVTASVSHGTLEMASTLEAVSAVTVTGSVSHVVHEMASTTESVSTVVITASKTDVVLEMASTTESVSVVTVVPSVTHQVLEMASTNEAVSVVTVTASVTHVTLEMDATLESISTVTVTAGKTDVTLEMDATLEAVSTVTIVGEKSGSVQTHEMASTLEAVSAVTITPSVTHQTLEMASTLEAVSGVTITATNTHATHEMTSTLEGVSTVTITAAKTDVVLEVSFTAEAISIVTIIGEKSGGTTTHEMALTLEAVSRVYVASNRTMGMTMTVSSTSIVSISPRRTTLVGAGYRHRIPPLYFRRLGSREGER